MDLFMLIMTAVALSMDAFAVSLTNGMCYPDSQGKKMSILAALMFGIFQAVMPIIGYFAGITFTNMLSQYDHWIALVLLCYIGIKMIVESFKQEENTVSGLSVRFITVQAIATSIDALAVGVSLAAVNVNIWISSGLIGCTTFLLSAVAVFIGRKCGSFLKQKAQIAGGIILVLIGIKIFAEHMFG